MRCAPQKCLAFAICSHATGALREKAVAASGERRCMFSNFENLSATIRNFLMAPFDSKPNLILRYSLRYSKVWNSRVPPLIFPDRSTNSPGFPRILSGDPRWFPVFPVVRNVRPLFVLVWTAWDSAVILHTCRSPGTSLCTPSSYPCRQYTAVKIYFVNYACAETEDKFSVSVQPLFCNTLAFCALNTT